MILDYSPTDKRLVTHWDADHMTTLAGEPVLVLDMYEHAYHMDCDAKAASYVGAYMEAIRSLAARPDFRSSAGTVEP